MAMAGRFTARRVPSPELVPAEESVLEGVSWTVFPEAPPEAMPSAASAHAANPLLTDKLLDAKVRLHRRLIEEINLSALEKLPEEEIRGHIQQLVSQYVLVERLALNTQELNDFVSEILDEMTGLGPLEPLLKDPTVNDILINGHECVYVERRGMLEPTGVRFKDEAHLLRIINKIVSAVGRRVDESHPMCDARLLDGSRVNVAVRPVAVDGPLMSIRKFSKKPINLNKLVDIGALRPQMAELLAAAVKARMTLIISGGTGSGKTTMLNALSAFISEKERLLTIEDAAELQLQQPHVGRMETRPPNIEGKGEIRQRDLVKNALRMRPDRVILGECRGEEAFDMLQAMNTGHEGSMATDPRQYAARRDFPPRADDRHGRPADDGRLDPRPDRRRHPRHRAIVAALRRQAPGDEHRRDHRPRRRHRPDAGNLQVRAHRHVDGRQRAGPFPGHRRAPALPHRSHRHGDQNPRFLFRPVATAVVLGRRRGHGEDAQLINGVRMVKSTDC